MNNDDPNLRRVEFSLRQHRDDLLLHRHRDTGNHVFGLLRRGQCCVVIHVQEEISVGCSSWCMVEGTFDLPFKREGVAEAVDDLLHDEFAGTPVSLVSN